MMPIELNQSGPMWRGGPMKAQRPELLFAMPPCDLSAALATVAKRVRETENA